ncbi:hypothetical protein PAMA_008997 [Pampus argenteus]
MQYLKKYFTEGLIQMAILLSLCGVRVDVGLEPYLPPSLHEMILGPTSALTQTEFHNLRNRLEDGHHLHPKSVDLDGFFTTRRLLGWVHSLDRLQVPYTEVETWLVQREPDSLPVERDRTAPPAETRAEEEEDDDKEEGTHHVLHHSAAMDEKEEEEEEEQEEEEEEEDLASTYRHYFRGDGRGRLGGSYHQANNRELTQNEADQDCWSLFTFSDEQQLYDVGARRGDLEHQPPGREPQLSAIIPTDNASLDLELRWQDLFTIMEPEITDIPMMTSFDHALDSRPFTIFDSVWSEALQQNSNNYGNGLTETDQEDPLMDSPWQHGLLSSGHSDVEPALLPLTPSAELDDHSSAINTSHLNPMHSPPDYMGLLAEDLTEDFCMGLNQDINLSTLNLLIEDPVDDMERSLCSQYAPYPENLANFESNDLIPPSSTPASKGKGVTQDLPKSPSGVFVIDEEEDVEDEDGLPSPLSDLEDAATLDEIGLLDLVLEEGFSPEIAARLEEEDYLDSEIEQQEPSQVNHNITSKEEREDNHSDSCLEVTDEQGQPRSNKQDGEDEADSDSGLSLDFSHSLASPCTSEASSYSSSSTSSSSCVSSVGSTFSEDEDEDAEDRLVGSDVEVEVTIKQEDQEEEEIGAVGGGYSEDVNKLFPSNYRDHKMFNGFPWLEHIIHDHRYNQPFSSISSPPLGKMTTKHTRSSLRHENDKPYHCSSSRYITNSKIRNRDERHARALKIPFSNELIVNLPVDDFNELLANYQLNEEQLTLVKDIRRRGKNKIAAQNCRQRKLGTLLGLEEEVSELKHRRSRLLREKQEMMRNLQEMKRRLNMYEEVYSRLMNEERRPLEPTEHQLQFGPNGRVTVAPRQPGAGLPTTREKSRKKQKDKKK